MMYCIHEQIKKLMDKAKKERMKKTKMMKKLRHLNEKQQDQAMLISKGKKEDEGERETRKSVTNDSRHVWFKKNNQLYTPLELAAKHGLIEIFNDILNLQDVYCHLGQQDGMFDEKSYDITEIDAIAKYSSQEGVCDEGKIQPKLGWSPFRRYPKQESVLQMMCSSQLKFSDMAALLDLPPIKLLIKKKWHFYRKPYIAWMLCHYVFVVVLRIFTVCRSEIVFSLPVTYSNPGSLSDNSSRHPTAPVTGTSAFKEGFVAVAEWILFAIDIIYLIIGVWETLIKIRKPNASEYAKDNINSLTFIFVISVGIITDVIMHQVWYFNDGIPMILAVQAAWWFNLFFFKGWRQCGFSKKIQQVVFDDLYRFSVVLVLLLVSFTPAMTVLYQGKHTPATDGTEDNPGHHTTYQSALLKMFNVMIGLTELPFLDQTKHNWLAYGLYVILILTTFILLINAFIAMMSSKCIHLQKNKYSQWRVQQLSVIIFLEDLLSLFRSNNTKCMTWAAGGSDVTSENVKMFNPSTGTVMMVRRYFLKMSSVVHDYSYDDVAETTASLENQEQRAAECITHQDIIKSIKQGIITESEPEEPVVDNNIIEELPSAEESDSEGNFDPLRYYTIYHEHISTSQLQEMTARMQPVQCHVCSDSQEWHRVDD